MNARVVAGAIGAVWLAGATATADVVTFARSMQRVEPHQSSGGPGREAPVGGEVHKFYVTTDGDILSISKAADTEAIEALEKKFWALMRVLARRGLVTKEEFLSELRAGDEGTVLLRVLVDETGRPREVSIETSSGHRLLDQAAREQVLAKWRFHPATRQGRAVAAYALVPIDFKLP